MNKKWRYRALLALTIVVLLVIILTVPAIIQNSHVNQLTEQGFFPVRTVMAKAGYENESEDNYIFKISSPAIKIEYDFQNGECTKNQYQFDITDSFIIYDDDYYINDKVLESILNSSIKYEDGEITAKEVKHDQHEWTAGFAPVVAHAGGMVREAEYNTSNTNSLEALIQNYNLGHRVFEFDFCLTSDNKLAVLHDWAHLEELGGEAVSSEEWINYQTPGKPITEGRYTTMLVGDILDQMLVNRDMFLITDTKSYDLSDEETLEQFQIIYDEAVKRDPKLLDRIIPQIYNIEMYDLIAQIYEYPSVIYTLYSDKSLTEDIVAFASDPENNIKVITVPVESERFSDGLVEELNESDLLLYVHTVNDFSDITDNSVIGVDGFYTDSLLPADYEVYNKIKDNK